MTSTGGVASKAELSYEILRSRILDGTYGPGYQLVMDRLAREIGVSTIPLREALRRLQSDGLVEVVRNLGARVAVFDAAQVRHTLEVLNRAFYFSVYEHCDDEHLNFLLEAEWTRLDHMRRSVFGYLPGRARRSVEEHEHLLDLIAGGADPAQIERLACAHKTNTAGALYDVRVTRG
ncbi:GntR family transcriptional regulator [Nonomuraea sp. NPDC052265]|uniref:GntR family transcriptional regulator n=1 Tax=Nonomuraea sp. NPDC052265 TaxID=3364374 RepID=UPI0037CB3835